ncbi:MAG: flagellar hook assembly protein FlgD [Rhodospirillaceae bacterium]
MTDTSITSVANSGVSSAATSAINAAANSSKSSSATSSASSLEYNFKEFLTLFTTQLKNQDPTKPMDTTEMTNQLALFSNVEQTAGINTRLDKLLAAQTTSGLNSAVGYIGKTVQAGSGNQIALSSGSALVAYNMPQATASVNIDIRDSNGGLVASLTGSGAAGNQQVSWNGKDNSGAQLADGVYSITVTAPSDSAQSAITPVPYITGKVTGVETSGTDTMLDLGALQVKMSDIQAIRS